MKFSCREASKLISAGLDRSLTLREHIKLRMHLMLCGNCTQFSRQLAQIRQVARHAGLGE